MFEYTPYILPFTISAIIVALLGSYAWQYRYHDVARAFAIVMLLAFVWTIGFIFEHATIGLSEKLFWSNVAVSAIALIPASWSVMALMYIDSYHKVKQFVFFLFVIPIISIFLMWTNDFHHLFRNNPFIDTTTASFAFLDNDYGVWFNWVHAPYGYLVFLGNFVLLIRSAIFAETAFRKQILMLIVAFMLPLFSDLMFFLGYSPIPDLNLTPIVFGLSGILIAWNLLRYKFLDLMPAARSKLVEVMQDGWIVLDSGNRLVDSNSTAQKMLGIASKNNIGQSIIKVFANKPNLLNVLRSEGDIPKEIRCEETDESLRYYELQLEKLYDQNGYFSGELIILRDISDRKAMEEAQSMLIQELQDALAQIKTLEGLIPICANCKKIRDDQGYWQEVEGYVMEHSHAEFSHSICPTCAKKLYSSLYDE